MAKQLIPLNELDRVTGGVLTYQNQQLDMSMSVSELNSQYSDIGFKSKIESNFGAIAWQELKNMSLQAACDLYGESVFQSIIDNGEAGGEPWLNSVDKFFF